MFFISREHVAILDAGFVVSDDDSSVICIFDCFEDVLVDFGCIDWIIFLFWAYIKGTFGGESVVLYRCSGCMFDAAVMTFMFFVVVKTIVFSLFNVTRSKMELCFLFFDGVEAVTFLDDAVFSLVLLLGLVVSAFGFDFWGSS